MMIKNSLVLMKTIIKNIIVNINKVFNKIYTTTGIKKKLGYVALGEFNSWLINPLWTTIDCFNDSDIYLLFDEKCQFPFNDETLNIIYTSHMLEHIDIPTCTNIFKEANRCLKKGGKILIDVPNCEYLYDAYKLFVNQNDISMLKNIFKSRIINNKPFFSNITLERIQSNIDFKDIDIYQIETLVGSFIVNYMEPDFNPPMIPCPVPHDLIKQLVNTSLDEFVIGIENVMHKKYKNSGGHQTGWYFKRLEEYLKDYGFKVKIRSFKKGMFKNQILNNILIPDRKHRRIESLYVEAEKI